MASTPAANTTLGNRLIGDLNPEEITSIDWVDDPASPPGYWIVHRKGKADLVVRV